MEQETLFTSAKWSILQELALQGKSPLELAELANTSMSNVSQSLRFLELANIVKSVRVSNRDKGQPRIVYSLAKDSAYLIVTSNGFVEKGFIEVDDNKKSLFRIWLHPNKELHNFLEGAYFYLKSYLDNIQSIFLDSSSSSNDLVFKIVFKDKAIKLQSQVFKFNNISKKVSFQDVSADYVKKNVDALYAIHNPQKISEGNKNEY